MASFTGMVSLLYTTDAVLSQNPLPVEYTSYIPQPYRSLANQHLWYNKPVTMRHIIQLKTTFLLKFNNTLSSICHFASTGCFLSDSTNVHVSFLASRRTILSIANMCLRHEISDKWEIYMLLWKKSPSQNCRKQYSNYHLSQSINE